MKTVILGNSGSGKTWLASELARKTGTLVVSLDEIFWEPGGFDRKRSPETVERILAGHLASEAWIAEGVFGNLAARFLRSADELILLEMPWEVCRAQLLSRGSESKTHMSREQSQAGLAELVSWAEKYYEKSGDCSYKGHEELFLAFAGKRLRLGTKIQVAAYINEV